MALGEYWTTEDSDQRHLYHDVLIAIDENRRLNNGQPSLWALMYDNLDLSDGAHVVHVGAGTGYYSAILAEIVGRAGRVTAIEIDPVLAARASENLASRSATGSLIGLAKRCPDLVSPSPHFGAD